MSVGASNKFTVIIFTQKCCRSKPSGGEYPKSVFRGLHQDKFSKSDVKQIVETIVYLQSNSKTGES